MNSLCLGFVITFEHSMAAVGFREASTWLTDAACRREWSWPHRNEHPERRVWRMYYQDGQVKMTQIAGPGWDPEAP
jgi:hypothetical protein